MPDFELPVVRLSENDAESLQAIVLTFRSEECPIDRCRQILAESANVILATLNDDRQPIGWLIGHMIPRFTMDEFMLYEIEVLPH
jgi:hypothetical protein